MTQVIVVLIGLVAGFVASRVLRSVRTSSNVRDRGARPSAPVSSSDRLRQLEADRALQQRPATARPPVPNVAPTSPASPPPAPSTWRLAGNDQTQLAGSADPYLVREGGPTGETHPLTGAAVTVGRGADRDLRVDEPRASREHGTFRPRRSGPGWTYTDLGSSNGTRINARAVRAHQRTELRDGDSIEIGPARFIFHAASAPPHQVEDTERDLDRTEVLDIDDDGPPR